MSTRAIASSANTEVRADAKEEFSVPKNRFYEASQDATVDRRYQVKREIARGGMGVVFEAEHLHLRSSVALKLLSKSALDVEAVHARLLREARALSRVRHPNIVPVLDAGICDVFGPFIALDMIEGRSLESFLVARQRLDVASTVQVVAQLADALDRVHEAGIIHRDVKPANVLISREVGRRGDTALLIDFGIARVPGEIDVVERKITRHGELLGTVEYMAPEQLLDGKGIDRRTDVYALGMLVYECLTGDVPYHGPPTVVMSALLSGLAPPNVRSKRADVPDALDRAVARALSHDPAKRQGSAGEFARECLAALGVEAGQLALIESTNDRVQSLHPGAPAMAPSDLRAQGAAPLRRQFVRAPYVTPARILASAGPCDGRTEDISEGGALVVTAAECGDGEKVKIRLPLPTSGRVVTLEAVTRWVKTKRGQRAIGVEFVDAGDDVKSEIRHYAELMTGAQASGAR